MTKYDVYRVKDLGPKKDLPFLNDWKKEKVGSIDADSMDLSSGKVIEPFRKKYQKGGWGIEIHQR
jgi:hypothetical protein